MRIGVDCLYADPGRTFGTWAYTVNLLEEMSELDGENEYIVFLSPKAAEQFPITRPNITLAPLRLAAHSLAARILCQNLLLPLLAKRYGVDLLHSTGNYGPASPGVPSVVTVHDLLFFFNRQRGRENSWSLRAGVRGFLMGQSLQRAAGVVVVSECTKRELLARYPFVAGKVKVIYNGLPRRRRLAAREAQAVLQGWRRTGGRNGGVSRPYLLSVGLFHPHKNIARLVEAFARVKGQLPRPYQLVLAGNLGRDRDDLYQAVSEAGIEKDVIFAGVVSEETVEALYALADLFVYPSLMEGFGLPVLEAMANETPVACSNTGSLPEVAGDAAILFDPWDVEDMARAIRQGLEDGELRSRLTERGRKRVERFSFRQAAEGTLRIYQEVVSSKR